MTTSTIWRSRSNGSGTRGASPVRPDQFIERLSPEPFEASAATHALFTSGRDLLRGQRVQGLGLLQTHLPDDRYAKPDHLYFDQNGGAHVGAKVRSKKHGSGRSDHTTRTGQFGDARFIAESSKYSKRSHTRSGSTIDDLANIAIATSPQLSASPSHSFSGSPITYSASRPATSYMNGYVHDAYDRPSKRIKSEKLPSTEWYPREERPRSSYEHHPQVRQEDAELLLSLRNAIPTSEPSVPVSHNTSLFQQSPYIQHTETTFAESSIPQNEEANIDLGLSDFNTRNTDLREELHNSEKESHDYYGIPVQTQIYRDSIVEDDSMAEQVQYGSSTIVSKNEEQPRQPILASTGTVEIETEEASPVPPPKKQRKVKPEVQAEVCASCQKLQLDGKDAESTMFWLGCEACKRWFHYPCAGFKDKQEARSVDKYICKDCEPKHGQTTFVRKSSRARTAIDYAGLNEGVIKSSQDTTMHHYVPKLKDGSLQVLPDDFARVRPELVTKEFWENMDGMKRPFVVPACWNPRFGDASTQPNLPSELMGIIPPIDPAHVHLDSQGEPLSIPDESELHIKNGMDKTQKDFLDVDQDYLDMVMPRDLTVQRVAQLYGPEEPVPVIDVKTQETTGKWSLQQWADYYDEPEKNSIRNVISLEVSNSRLGRLIRRPQAVRDIDLEDQVWEAESRSASNKRPVQFYCLMSVADSYTDFHIDFGGSSVYYHILKGVKTFFFIPPEDRYLKKYEEWCTSTTQSQTWLGDLCGGNVTRVDLHEGDTAFIPAGWIHSVWTPEDSLVVGGNYLTRYDFELQLKVAHLEKTTSVPLKYRYPFFQKVMWFTLIKYLEEDPVPEEILRDFQDDPDYRYLRANPIWLEQVDSSLACEPGEAGFNSRNYPKSELQGLPALRDYLYRTARIYADLAVEGGINKKQSDAVKASIPKGHGDPMQLIKTFAVWCAWKMGNVLVPEWVYSDSGLQPELEKREKEKAKKPEVFRVPPERVSARQKAQSTVAPSIEDGPSTPNSSKGSPLRIACEACRRRRIKCRHKDDATLDETAQQTLEKPRHYPNVGVDIAKLARASPIVSNLEASPLPEPPVDLGDTKDLAQAALARLNSQSSDSNGVAVTGASPGSTKKGRSKACEECRKSKRRCVHDEYGRVDPAKAAEPSKPRGSSSVKRPARLSDEHSAKRVKTEADLDSAMNIFTSSMDVDSVIDPALLGSAIVDDTESSERDATNGPSLILNSNVISMPPRRMSGEGLSSHPQEDNSLVGQTDPPNTNEQLEGYQNPTLTKLRTVSPTNSPNTSRTPDHDISYSPITVDGGPTESIEKLEPADQTFHSRSAGSRRSSRQSQLVDRYVPDTSRTPSKTQSKPTQNVRRGSSVTSPQTDVMSAKSRRSSSNTSGTTHRAAAAGTVADNTGFNPEVSSRPSIDGGAAKPSSRESTTVSSEEDADEKLARELQAAEHGLRRRASVRA